LNENGTGAGAFLNVASDGSLTQNKLFQSATPGQAVALFGTGLGPAADAAQEDDRPPVQTDVRSANVQVEVWVGNRQATVLYAGRSSYTAEDEVDFRVPNGVSGCYNEVTLLAGPPGGQTASNFTTLAVTDGGGICSDTDGINMADLAPAIASKGSANVGAIGMFSNYIDLTISGLGSLEGTTIR
jgi:uncharacterized protein (TIGR03437 family)